MAVEKHLSIQASILIAGALVAVAILLAPQLTHSLSPEPAKAGSIYPLSTVQASDTGASLPAVNRPPEPPSPAMPFPPAGPSQRSDVVQAVTDALNKRRAELTQKCLNPSLEKKPEPKSVKLRFQLTFDTQGKEVARSVSDDRETARPDVRDCVSDLTMPLVAPPGPTSVQIEVNLTLP